jgi:hypothetical protein
MTLRGALIGALLAGIAGGCASHRSSVGTRGSRREIAIVKVVHATGARLESINGALVPSPSEVRLLPRDYTLGVRYAADKSAAIEELSFEAEAGHLYELSAASPDVAGGQWTPVLVDDSTQTQIYPKK